MPQYAPEPSNFELPPASADQGPTWREGILQHAITARLRSADIGITLPAGSPLLDPDIDVCLGVTGAGCILSTAGAPEAYHGVALLLKPIGAQPPGASPIYLLASLEQDRDVQGGLTSGGTVAWRSMMAVGAFPGRRDLLLPAEPGGQLFAIRIGEDPPIMLATYASPCRATLITLSSDDHGPRIGQFHLQMGHLRSAVTSAVGDPATELAHMAMQARAIEALRRSVSVNGVVSAETMIAMPDGGSLEPILAYLAGYERLRRKRNAVQSEAVAILKQSFPDLRDIATLSPTHGASSGPAGVPLFLEGVLNDAGCPPVATASGAPRALRSVDTLASAHRSAVTSPTCRAPTHESQNVTFSKPAIERAALKWIPVRRESARQNKVIGPRSGYRSRARPSMRMVAWVAWSHRHESFRPSEPTTAPNPLTGAPRRMHRPQKSSATPIWSA